MTSSLYIKEHYNYVKRKKKERDRSHQSPQVRLSGLRNPGNFSLWNPPARSIEPKTRWKLVKSDANLKNQTVTSRVRFHLAKRQKLSFRSFNSNISARRQWISVTHNGSYKLDKSVLSNASRIVYYISAVTWYNKTKWSPKVSSATIIRIRETWELFCGLTIQPAFRNATTHSVFSRKMPPKKGSAQISYWWRVSTQIWKVLLIGWSKFPRETTDQKFYSDLESERSSAWNFCARSSDVISQQGN